MVFPSLSGMRYRAATTNPLAAAGCLAVIGTVEIALDPGFREAPLGPALVCATVVAGALLAVRWPVPGTWLVAALFPVAAVCGLSGPTGVGVLAIFLAPGWPGYVRPPRRSWAAPLGAQLLASLGVGLVELLGHLRQPQSQLGENLFFSSLCWASWGVGVVARRMRERAEQLTRLAAALDAEREARDRTILVEERQRIAREVHDSVAHTVSVMVLQLGALRSTLHPTDPAADTLRGVEDLGRTAVGEMRGLVGMLRESEAAPAPDPSLRRAEDLVAEVRAAGLPVELVRTGTAEPLPRALDVSAYRVLQEALTNVLRHAGPVPATVRLSQATDAVTVEVVNDPPALPGSAEPWARSGGGHGLVGMRERVAVYGGTLQAGARPDGGFRVLARFPLVPATA